MGPCRFSVIWLEFFIWRTLHQGGHSMVISEVSTYGGHLSKSTVVPAVYILEKVTTRDWTTEGTNSKSPFWEEAFLIDACKPEVKHFSFNMPWSYQIGILKCLFSHRNDLLKIWSKSHPKIAKRLLPVDVPHRSSWCYTRRFATTIFSATLLRHCCDVVSNSYNIGISQHCSNIGTMCCLKVVSANRLV